MTLSGEAVAELLAIAIRFSGLAPIDVAQVPEVVGVIGDYKWVHHACQSEVNACNRAVAIYNHQTNRIYYREDRLGDASSVIGSSYLVHEIVHVLQHHQYNGKGLYDTCDMLYHTEMQAYSVQNEYLASMGSGFRAGEAMKHFRCIEQVK